MKRRELIKNLGFVPLVGVTGSGFPSLLRENRGIKMPLEKYAKEKGRESIYESLGVRPVINGRGTITIIGGCRMLPEVEQAMREATSEYVEIDELMDAVGQRIGQFTGAQSAIVTTGATGALIMATTGILTGGNPDKLWQLPNLSGMKNEVIIPKYSWTAYESAIRGTGVKMVTVESRDELESALGPQTAMVLILAGSGSMNGPLSTKEISSIVKPIGVPILVDAAAEGLPLPNPHISQGADLVAYSGGKYLSGPQCAGLLIGREDLIKAAWVTSSPHHGYGRGYKVGREEILGMLAAVEMWRKRDHDKEMKIWTARLNYIANRLKSIQGVTAEVHQPPPEQLSNPSPSLRVKWDTSIIRLTGYDVERILWDNNPRVAVSGMGSFLPFPPNLNPNIEINSSQLNDGEEKIIADRVFEVLSHPPVIPKLSGKPSFNIDGEWDLEMKFAAGIDHQKFVFEQNNNELKGTHFASYGDRELFGTLYGNSILVQSSYTLNGSRLNFSFSGNVNDNNSMGGHVSLSEYGMADWKATRHIYAPRGSYHG